jgi:hypothetical protein
MIDRLARRAGQRARHPALRLGVRPVGGQQQREQARKGVLDSAVDAALKKEVEKLKYIAERNPSAPFMHEVSIIGDRRIPYEVLSSVLYTAGQNELENFRFVVISKGDE